MQNLYKLGDFSDFLEERQGKLFEEQEITRILANIIIAVHHINTSNIFHRDLKPQNFLFKIETNGLTYLHLNDFGFAKSTNPDSQRLSSLFGGAKGTIEYLAPEILD